VAQHVQTFLVDDLTGKDIPDGQGQTLDFSIQGIEYQIDLSDANIEKFNLAMAPYVERGRVVHRLGKATYHREQEAYLRKRANRRATLVDKEQAVFIRAWAVEQGMKVSKRGVIAQQVLDAYNEAHGDQAMAG
jgi:Lsr2